MGRCKATIEVEGVANAERLARLLIEGGADPVVFVGGQSHDGLESGIWVRDREAGAGPLSGVLGFGDWFPNRDAVVLATDLFRFDVAALAWLLEQAGCAKGKCVWPVLPGRTIGEPLASFYAAPAWRELARAWEAGQRGLMRSLPMELRYEPVAPADLVGAFRGANTEGELEVTS